MPATAPRAVSVARHGATRPMRSASGSAIVVRADSSSGARARSAASSASQVCPKARACVASCSRSAARDRLGAAPATHAAPPSASRPAPGRSLRGLRFGIGFPWATATRPRRKLSSPARDVALRRWESVSAASRAIPCISRSMPSSCAPLGRAAAPASKCSTLLAQSPKSREIHPRQVWARGSSLPASPVTASNSSPCQMHSSTHRSRTTSDATPACTCFLNSGNSAAQVVASRSHRSRSHASRSIRSNRSCGRRITASRSGGSRNSIARGREVSRIAPHREITVASSPTASARSMANIGGYASLTLASMPAASALSRPSRCRVASTSRRTPAGHSSRWVCTTQPAPSSWSSCGLIRGGRTTPCRPACGPRSGARTGALCG